MPPKQEFKEDPRWQHQAFEDGNFGNTKIIQPPKQLKNRPASCPLGSLSLHGEGIVITNVIQLLYVAASISHPLLDISFWPLLPSL